ncbi:MAG: hypothetical protein WA099_09990 [Sulfuricurvum sp.]
MSWVTSAKCFNGLVCIGDIQATITFQNLNKKKYINCVKKVHHIYDNLIVGFAGDIKTALLMIEKLKIQLNDWLEKDTYFYLDGQSDKMVHNLQVLYDEIRGGSQPYVELLFCWYSQDEDENKWTMYNWKFKSPNFVRDSNGTIQSPTQIGSGNQHQNFQNALAFLTGDSEKRTEKYKEIFESTPDMIIWTITKYRNFLINQARQENFPGVSKSFHSFDAIVNYDKLYTKEDHKKIDEIYKQFDLEFEPINVDGDPIFGVEFSERKLLEAFNKDKLAFANTMNTIQKINSRVNIEALFEPPIFKEIFHRSSDEVIEDPICSTWVEFENLMKNKYKITFNSVGTTALA